MTLLGLRYCSLRVSILSIEKIAFSNTEDTNTPLFDINQANNFYKAIRIILFLKRLVQHFELKNFL